MCTEVALKTSFIVIITVIFIYFAGEVKTVLVDFAVGVSGRCSSVRKITPITADSLIDICITTTTTVTDKQLQVSYMLNKYYLKRLIIHLF